MDKDKLATASAAGMLGIISSILLVLSGILFIGFGETFTKDLAPLFSGGNLNIIAGILNIIFAIVMIIGGVLIYSFKKYRIGGLLILFSAIVGVISGGGFYVSTLWGTGAGAIAMICPNLEEKILQSENQD